MNIPPGIHPQRKGRRRINKAPAPITKPASVSSEFSVSLLSVSSEGSAGGTDVAVGITTGIAVGSAAGAAVGPAAGVAVGLAAGAAVIITAGDPHGILYAP